MSHDQPYFFTVDGRCLNCNRLTPYKELQRNKGYCMICVVEKIGPEGWVDIK
jgi:hypothetical protein